MTEDRFQSEFCAEKLKALGDPTRLMIVDLLRNGQRSVGDIAELLQMEIVLVSHHLGVLHNAGILGRKKQGRYVFYRLKDGLLVSTESNEVDHLNLGCCRIEVPRVGDSGNDKLHQLP